MDSFINGIFLTTIDYFEKLLKKNLIVAFKMKVKRILINGIFNYA